jgi:DNA-binding MarR family transcriptional regulator
MPRRSIDRDKVKELFDAGLNATDIAKELSATKGAISKVIKSMNLEVVKAAVEVAPQYVERKDTATDHLLYLTDKARAELDWIEKEVPPKKSAEYRAWQDQKLKFGAEVRKLISAMGDIAFKLYQANEVAETLKIIEEEIGCESPECQKRIRDRIKRRRDIRFPVSQS